MTEASPPGDYAGELRADDSCVWLWSGDHWQLMAKGESGQGPALLRAMRNLTGARYDARP